MTNQQAPVDISRSRIEKLQELGCADHIHMALLDALEAAERRIKELEREANDAKRAAVGFEGMYNTACTERDQALASVGAVIEKAANLMADWWNHPGGLDGTPAEIVLTINPDATAALNEMLADAWEEGHDEACAGWRAGEPNPYRKATT